MADGDVKFIEEERVPGKGLGRSIIEHDERSRDFPVRALFGNFAAEPLTSKKWCCSMTIFDQSSTSACVGHSVGRWALTEPNGPSMPMHILSLVRPYDLYRLAQAYDPWPLYEPSYYGTSTLAGFKAARYCGFIMKYRWAFSPDEARRTISKISPIVIGVNWYSSFDNPGPTGELKITNNAFIRGGHAMLADEIDVTAETIGGPQSWGKTWGDKGRWKMSWATFDRLMDEDGEAACGELLAPNELPVPTSPPNWSGAVAA